MGLCWSSGDPLQQEQLKAGRVQYSRWLKKLLPGSSTNPPCNGPFSEFKCHKEGNSERIQDILKGEPKKYSLRKPGMTQKVQYFQLWRWLSLGQSWWRNEHTNCKSLEYLDSRAHFLMPWLCHYVEILNLEICGLSNISQDKGGVTQCSHLSHRSRSICFHFFTNSSKKLCWS